MSESTGEKKFSIWRFLLMPQFNLCFQGAAHLYPIFIQILAAMFVSAGLLPVNHPATRYGTPGVRKYSINDLFGEAWYSLRTRKSDVRQWGLFAGVAIMCLAFVGAIFSFVVQVIWGFGTIAHAQLFALQNPISGAAVTTDLTAVGGIPSASGLMFDKRFSSTQGLPYDDWGLILLDKIVRQAASTPQTGGKLQNAFSALILVYNTAVTVVAAVMIFWIILSVVVDTAKTGILGGGRHNMVWAPIRIVFALGIMIPLGTAGFSSGQYCVMKLAEWGSNLGSNGWSAYVNAVANSNDMLASVHPKGTAGLVKDIGEMKICQVAYNNYTVRQMGASAPQLGRNLIGAINTWSPDGTKIVHSFGNSLDQQACGALTLGAPGGLFPVPASGAQPPGWSAPAQGTVPNRPNDNWSGTAAVLDDVAQVGLAVLGTPIPVASMGLGGTSLGNSPFTNGGYQAAQMLARQRVASALLGAIPAVESQMRDFACVFVSHMAPGGPTSVANALDVNINWTAASFAPAGAICPGASGAGCGAGAPPAPPAPTPTLMCHNAAVAAFNTALAGGGGTGLTGALGAIAAWLNLPASNPNGMLGEMKRYGWAGAGAFYHKVTEMNTSVQSLAQPSVTYQPGTLRTTVANCDNSKNVADCDPSGILKEVGTILQEYTRWYEGAALSGVGMAGTGDLQGITTQAVSGDKPAGGGLKGILKGLLGGSSGVINSIIARILGLPENRDMFFGAVIGSVGDNTLPLANLSKIGFAITALGTGIILAESVIQAAFGAIPFMSGAAAAQAAIFTFISSGAQALIVSGMLLTFYVPILPFIRSAFAVLTWMVTVFEAVVMVPIAALAHLTTEGEGLAAGARQCWVLWLNVLLKPILFVIGFIGAFLVYDAFIVYFTVAFSTAAANSSTQDNILTKFIAYLYNAVVYVGVCYAAANSIFKMVDIIPNALMRWLPGASVDHSFDDASQAAASYGGQLGSMVGKSLGGVSSDAAAIRTRKAAEGLVGGSSSLKITPAGKS